METSRSLQRNGRRNPHRLGSRNVPGPSMFHGSWDLAEGAVFSSHDDEHARFPPLSPSCEGETDRKRSPGAGASAACGDWRTAGRRRKTPWAVSCPHATGAGARRDWLRDAVLTLAVNQSTTLKATSEDPEASAAEGKPNTPDPSSPC